MHSYSLIHFVPFSFDFWPPFFAVVWLAFCPLSVLRFRFPIPGSVLGPVSIGLLCLSACSVCPGASVVVWLVCFPVGVLWCCGCVLAFGGCCLCLPLLFCAFFLCCLGLLRIGSFPPGSVPRLSCPPPRLVPWAFWRLRPCVGSALYTMLRVLIWCFLSCTEVFALG